MKALLKLLAAIVFALLTIAALVAVLILEYGRGQLVSCPGCF